MRRARGTELAGPQDLGVRRPEGPVAGRRARPPSGRKDRALLGFLALSPGVTYSRERPAALLWSDSGERQARDSLKQALLRLRNG